MLQQEHYDSGTVIEDLADRSPHASTVVELVDKRGGGLFTEEFRATAEESFGARLEEHARDIGRLRLRLAQGFAVSEKRDAITATLDPFFQKGGSVDLQINPY